MADFIIRVLKWLAALVTAYFVLFILFILVLIGLAVSFQPVPQTVEENSILVLDLGLGLSDKPSAGDPLAIITGALSGEIKESVSLRQVLNALNKAKNDSDIHGLYITGNLRAEGYGGSFATLKEFRQTIEAFGRKKPVWSFIKGDSLRDYYIKSAATEVYSDPYAMVDFRGLRAEQMYLGDAFEKWGIEFQVSAFEEFKTAGESYTSGHMSDKEREQLKSLLDDLWENIVTDISGTRGVTVSDLNALAASDLIVYAEDVTEGKLADSILNEDELYKKLVDIVGYDREGESFQQFDFLDYVYMDMSVPEALNFGAGGNKVAVLYIEGIIVDGKGDDRFVGAEAIIEHLKDLRDDESVKALVIRVSSPGGSATASSRIAREILLTRNKMPVVVSMGGVGASGGYMVAAVGDQIFVEPTTITGSIGVVSMLPNIEKLADKLSINFEGVETHKFAGSFSLARSKNEEEMRQIRALGAQTYDEFLQMVAVNRDMTLPEVRAVAKGRVWSGKAALQNGLADTEGGLMAAIQRAADMAGIGDDYKVIDRPRVLTLEEQIQEMLVGSKVDHFNGSAGLQSFVQDMEEELRRLKSFDDPHGQYAILPYSLKVY